MKNGVWIVPHAVFCFMTGAEQQSASLSYSHDHHANHFIPWLALQRWCFCCRCFAGAAAGASAAGASAAGASAAGASAVGASAAISAAGAGVPNRNAAAPEVTLLPLSVVFELAVTSSTEVSTVQASCCNQQRT